MMNAVDLVSLVTIAVVVFVLLVLAFLYVQTVRLFDYIKYLEEELQRRKVEKELLLLQQTTRDNCKEAHVEKWYEI